MDIGLSVVRLWPKGRLATFVWAPATGRNCAVSFQFGTTDHWVQATMLLPSEVKTKFLVRCWILVPGDRSNRWKGSWIPKSGHHCWQCSCCCDGCCYSRSCRGTRSTSTGIPSTAVLVSTASTALPAVKLFMVLNSHLENEKECIL